MANSNNAGINYDDIQKAKDYKDALASSLTGVNAALPDFSGGQLKV